MKDYYTVSEYAQLTGKDPDNIKNGEPLSPSTRI